MEHTNLCLLLLFTQGDVIRRARAAVRACRMHGRLQCETSRPKPIGRPADIKQETMGGLAGGKETMGPHKAWQCIGKCTVYETLIGQACLSYTEMWWLA